jgi:hypothetical protein
VRAAGARHIAADQSAAIIVVTHDEMILDRFDHIFRRASATATTRLGRRWRSLITHGSALVAFERSRLALAPLSSAGQSSFSSDHHRTDTDAADIGPTPGCAPIAELDCLQHYAIARSSTIFAGETGEDGRHQDCAS